MLNLITVEYFVPTCRLCEVQIKNGNYQNKCVNKGFKHCYYI